MLQSSLLPRAIFPLAFLFLFCQNVFSQGSRPFRYSDEIGVDFAPFLRGETGASLLYKHILSKAANPESKKRYALRMLLGYYDYAYGHSSYLKQVGDSIFLTEGSGKAKHRFLNAGAELQIRKKNFRFHFGADLGYRYWTSLGESQHLTQVGGMRFITEEYDHESKANVVQGSVVGGVSYFFLPRFSIGMEANVSAAFEFSKSKLIQNGAVVFDNNNTLIEVDMHLFRLLYLSYHFGGTAKK